MNETIVNLTKGLSENATLDPIRYNDLLATIDCKFPPDYLAFMKARNGGEGFIAEGRYVKFWPLEELLEANEDYYVHEFTPALFLIGTDGGGNAFGLKRKEGIFIEIHFMDISDGDAEECGEDFTAFLTFLSQL